MSVDRLAEVESILDDEGLFYSREDDAEAFRIAFKSEGDRYFIVAYKDDEEFLMMGSGWAIGGDADIGKALAIANRTNARKKFVKTALWPEEGDVLFTVELAYADVADFRDHFVRLLGALRESAADFFGAMRSDEPV